MRTVPYCTCKIGHHGLEIEQRLQPSLRDRYRIGHFKIGAYNTGTYGEKITDLTIFIRRRGTGTYF
jgi:hypothetical protein